MNIDSESRNNDTMVKENVKIGGMEMGDNRISIIGDIVVDENETIRDFINTVPVINVDNINHNSDKLTLEVSEFDTNPTNYINNVSNLISNENAKDNKRVESFNTVEQQEIIDSNRNNVEIFKFEINDNQSKYLLIYKVEEKFIFKYNIDLNVIKKYATIYIYKNRLSLNYENPDHLLNSKIIDTLAKRETFTIINVDKSFVEENKAVILDGKYKKFSFVTMINNFRIEEVGYLYYNLKDDNPHLLPQISFNFKNYIFL
jgi:hypothetical protein